MKLYRSFAVIILLSTLFSASCARTTTPPSSSSAGALTANSALNNAGASRRFGRHSFSGAGANYLNDFVRPEVRARLDEEPTGDTDGGFDPATSGEGTSGGDQVQGEPAADTPAEEATQEVPGENDESYSGGSRLDTLKFSWAKKAFGDAVNASPTNNGVIVLYADENYYDVDRLMGFVEEGRNRITESSATPGVRIQVVFGGYRAVPQVELWVVAQGSPMPEFKTEERSRTAQPEN